MTSSFDSTAQTFERLRPLPREVPQAIRAAIWRAAALSGTARVLDVGAGTGRIGRAFVEAGDDYYGVDSSLAMLQEFSVDAANCTLAHVDASHLPYSDGSFDVVLLMHVLSGAQDWSGVVSEARRMVRSGGCIAAGHTANPDSGVDAKMKRRLKHVLEELGVHSFGSEQARRQALSWLHSSAAGHTHLVAASWNVAATPEGFLERHRTGARFAQLPAEVQEQALNSVRAWAEAEYGSLRAELTETRAFEVDLFTF